MQEIIDKYDTIGSSYLLPIILDAKTDERKQYKNAAQLVNSKTKEIGKTNRPSYSADELCGTSRLGFYRQKQKHSVGYHQRSYGT